jgi:tetratricopeptide (TPR) repeat protein
LLVTRVRRTHRAGKHSLEDDDSRALLAKLESLYDAGLYAEATALGESMLSLPGSAAFRGRIRLDLALTHLQLGKADAASLPLAEAKAHFQAVNDAKMIVECMAAEARVACFEQRPDALELAKKALVACRSLREDPDGLELTILSSVASAQVLVGQKSEAISTFEAAIKRADPVVDMRRLGKLLGNAAIAYKDLGQLEKAVTYSNRAVALFETLHDLVSLAREENNLGYYLIRCGELASARSHLERSLQLFEQTDLRRGRSMLLLSLCELCLAEGNIGQALTHADAALEAGESQSERWSIADARIWKGRIAVKLGDDVGADDEFQRALAVLANSGMTNRLVDCHAEYAQILEGRGDLPRAYVQLRAAFHIRERRRDIDSITGD